MSTSLAISKRFILVQPTRFRESPHVFGNHRLLPVFTGELLNRLDVVPTGDHHIFVGCPSGWLTNGNGNQSWTSVNDFMTDLLEFCFKFLAKFRINLNSIDSGNHFS